ncbi:hypothetical protein DXG03_006060 [Asterophora parasitica]|uniref:Uncharacterized protein n=1 Tax=Asterophora parasitica TaxID=117018 RepID=A0A9P7K7A5_9AGAR|nr:hypothetical protein DXG03_006060 [Asterophora parasitica]
MPRYHPPNSGSELKRSAGVIPDAPNELWRLIFRFATLSHKSSPLYDTSYHYFRDSWLDDQYLDDTLPMKMAITLVCIRWRRLAEEFLYEHVRVCTLARLFEDRPDEERRAIGRFVKRLQLPSRPLHPSITVDNTFSHILTFCPRVTILVQPRWLGGIDSLNRVFWGDIVNPSFRSCLAALLPKVRRVDWCTYGHERNYEHHCAILSTVLQAAPRLRYLSMRFRLDPFPGPSHITLPSLTTLRVEGELGNYGLRLPSLTHLIADNIQVASDTCLFASVPNLRLLQLCGPGAGYQFDVFRLAPHLTEFCCSLHRDTTVVLGCLHAGVRTIRLFCAKDPDRRTVTGFQKKSAMLYTRTSFPALERIVLHGEGWQSVRHTAEFRLFRLRIVDRLNPMLTSGHLLDAKVIGDARMRNTKVLSAKERHRCKFLLSNAEAALFDLDQTIGGHQMVDGLLEQRKTHEVRIQKYRVAIAPHKRLPLELLGAIFAYFMPDFLVCEYDLAKYMT